MQTCSEGTWTSHIQSQRYELIDEQPPAELPAWLDQALAPMPPPQLSAARLRWPHIASITT